MQIILVGEGYNVTRESFLVTLQGYVVLNY